MSEAAWLLDVNALIALLSRDHVHHERMHQWFKTHSYEGWATCPITENGVVRIMSQDALGAVRLQPSKVVSALRATSELHAKDHHFWADAISITDDTLFRIEYILGPKLVTDAYLLGLAAKHGAKLVSFDRTLPWQAIRNGTALLVETPLLQ